MIGRGKRKKTRNSAQNLLSFVCLHFLNSTQFPNLLLQNCVAFLVFNSIIVCFVHIYIMIFMSNTGRFNLNGFVCNKSIICNVKKGKNRISSVECRLWCLRARLCLYCMKLCVLVMHTENIRKPQKDELFELTTASPSNTY